MKLFRIIEFWGFLTIFFVAGNLDLDKIAFITALKQLVIGLIMLGGGELLYRLTLPKRTRHTTSPKATNIIPINELKKAV